MSSSGDDSIEVGGKDRLPEYPRAYFEAARRLLGASDEDPASVALPLVYLQRHCLELIIKDLHLASSFLSAAKEMAAGKSAPPERPPEHHRLVDLVVALQGSLLEHAIPMPCDLELLARDMDAIEASSPDRYRYAFQRLTKSQKGKGEGPEESFPTPQRIPLRKLQKRLGELIPIADIRDKDSLVSKLYAECTIVLNQAMASGNITIDPKIFT